MCELCCSETHCETPNPITWQNWCQYSFMGWELPMWAGALALFHILERWLAEFLVIFRIGLVASNGFVLFLVRFIGELVIVRHETLLHCQSWQWQLVYKRHLSKCIKSTFNGATESLIFNLKKSLQWQGSPSWTCGRHGGTYSLDLHCWSMASGMSMRCWHLHQEKQV